MIIEKQMEYSKSQIEEFQKIFKELNDSGKIYITEEDVKRAVFGTANQRGRYENPFIG